MYHGFILKYCPKYKFYLDIGFKILTKVSQSFTSNHAQTKSVSVAHGYIIVFLQKQRIFQKKIYNLNKNLQKLHVNLSVYRRCLSKNTHLIDNSI
jgi:hypothetical protein